mgnify:CR=1 FL=1
MKNYNVSDEPVTKVAVDIDDIKDTSREKSLNKECVFLMAGRMIYRKGLDFLFDALMRIPQETRYQVRVVGDGPELEHLRKRCKDDLNLSEHVHCMGPFPIWKWKRNMHVRMYLLCQAFERQQARSYWRQCQRVFQLLRLTSLVEQLFLMKIPVGFMKEIRRKNTLRI